MARSVLKAHATTFQALLRLLDPLFAITVGWMAYRLYLDDWSLPDRYVVFVGALALAIAALFPVFGLYEPQRGVALWEELRRLLLAWLALAAAAGVAIFATKSGEAFSRVWVTALFAAGFAASASARAAVRLALRQLRRHGRNLRHIAIVGAGTLGRTIRERLRDAPWAGFQVAGFFDDDPAKVGTQVAGVAVLGDLDAVAPAVAGGGIDQVWIALPLRAELRIRALLHALQNEAVEVRFVPDIYNFALLHHTMSEIAGMPVINLTESPLQGANVAIKRVEDLVLAALFLVVAAPVMLLIAIGVKLSSPGPVLYRQERVTWNGARFAMLKFRTMGVDSESATGPVWAGRGERRATPFGALIRRLSLDELPQLINVVRGEMSIVGPRPERPEFVARFREEIPRYMQKHLVKAGITGWAQVNDLRGQTDLSERIRYDLYYIEHWSLWFDLRIVALTLGHVIRSRNAY